MAKATETDYEFTERIKLEVRAVEKADAALHGNRPAFIALLSTQSDKDAQRLLLLLREEFWSELRDG